MRDTEKLLPCPFCGGEADFEEEDYSAHTYWRVICLECRCGTGGYCDNPGKKRAIDAWNKRV